MTLKIYSLRSQDLYDAIIQRIQEGKAETWALKNASDNKPRLIHTPDQWKDKVLLHLVPMGEYLGVVTQYWTGNQEPTDADCGCVLGRFLELLLVNFLGYFTKIEVNK